MKPIFLLFIIVLFIASFVQTGQLIKQTPPSVRGSTLDTTTSPVKAGDNPMITLIAGGDIMLGRSVNTRSLKNNDFTWAFKNISDEFSAADISLINLEAPFSQTCTPSDTGMIFCAPQEHIAGLRIAGIDIANLANNHIFNQGRRGLDYTVTLLKQNNIIPIGFEHGIKVVKGVRFGFLGFNALEKLDDLSITSQILELRKQVDVLVVTFHWGSEYSPKANPSQKRLARLSIDSGADVIIGHHPHWVQEKEAYNGKPIYYSLGNLIFDQGWSEKTQEGLVVKLFFSGKHLITSQDMPIKIYDLGQPKFVK